MLSVATSLPTKIVSGGQTGADRAALDFAILSGIPHGGWCPRGRRAEDGMIPTGYQLSETPGCGYGDRTERNVIESDATLIFNRGKHLSPGSLLTLRHCKRYNRRWLLVESPDRMDSDAIRHAAQRVAEFFGESAPAVLNVAGNRESVSPGIADFVIGVLTHAWRFRQP